VSAEKREAGSGRQTSGGCESECRGVRAARRGSEQAGGAVNEWQGRDVMWKGAWSVESGGCQVLETGQARRREKAGPGRVWR
jgi:hypothetical protein